MLALTPCQVHRHNGATLFGNFVISLGLLYFILECEFVSELDLLSSSSDLVLEALLVVATRARALLTAK